MNNLPTLAFYNDFQSMENNINLNGTEYYLDHVDGNLGVCGTKYDDGTSADIQMLKYINPALLYENYSNYNIELDVEIDSILKIFVVPYSQNDPDWLKIFDQHYVDDIKQILKNTIKFLNDNPDMKFIWYEISTFVSFFEKLNEDLKKKVINLVKSNQLEFVNGGWVITDEVNTHWHNILIQLTEGHKWLYDNFNVTPVSSFANNFLGHSSTIPFLLKKCDIENLIIQGININVKKFLSASTNLEFRWQAIFDESNDTELFTHIMPFKYYSTSKACGPNSTICEQFDFNSRDKLLSQNAVDITKINIKDKANLLLKQWRKTSKLYKTNSLLIPLGDYLSYREMKEFQGKYDNYKKLFDYINNENNFFATVRFSTLQDYFDSVRNDYFLTDFSSLSGDFFTNSYEKENYWRDYHKTKPYLKSMVRTLIHYIRSAEILRTWHDWSVESKLDENLKYARRQLSIIQHHEAITGPAKDHVVKDCEENILKAIEKCKFILQEAIYRLLTEPKLYYSNFQHEFFSIDLDWLLTGPNNSLTVGLNNLSILVFQNSLPQWRLEYVNVYVSNPFVIVQDSEHNKIKAQISLVWIWETEGYGYYKKPIPDSKRFKLTFKIKVPPLGLSTYIVESIGNETKNQYTSFAKTTIFTDRMYEIKLTELTPNVEMKSPEPFSILTKSGSIAYFNSRGMLRSFKIHRSLNVSLRINFKKYRNENGPNPTPIGNVFGTDEVTDYALYSSSIILTKGELESTVAVGFLFLIHTVLFRDDLGMEINNYLDISEQNDIEIVWKIETNINSDNVFYTDLNGFQFIKRINSVNMPNNYLHNFYVISNGMFIEDENYRLTLLTEQPLGGTADRGTIDIIQDQRLLINDSQGLNQSIEDNKPVQLKFRLLFESKTCNMDAEEQNGFLSMEAYTQYQRLHSPIIKLFWKNNVWRGLIYEFGKSHKPLDADMEIVALRNLEHNNEIGLIIHRTKLEKSNENKKGLVNIEELLNLKKEPQIYSTQLTFLTKVNRIASNNIAICPMDIKAYIIEK